MRLTRLFPPTLREPPTNCPSPGLAWLIRAGYLRLSESGWIHLPLGQRVLEQVKRILESEMSHLEAQRIGMPLSSGTDSHTPWDALAYTWDLPEPASPLAATQLEIIQNLAQRDLQTYRQLPCLLYHISPLATAPWERLAPLHLNSSVVLEAFALISAPAAQESSQRRFLQAAGNTFQRLGLTVRLARAGLTDALSAQILWLPHPQGDLSILHCSQCTYAALEVFATFKKPEPSPETPLPIERVSTPGVQTIRDLAAFLELPASRLAKAVFYLARWENEDTEHLVLALVRGDRTLSEAKLAHALGARYLRPAPPEAITAVGAVPGYASPIGLKPGVKVIVDDLIPLSPNLVAGANQPDAHLRHVNFGRDFSADLVTDLTLAEPDDPCPQCGAPLAKANSLPLAFLTVLGTLEGTAFLDENGQSRPLHMAYFRLSLDAALLALAEHYHDDHGLTWPVSLAPYAVHLVALGGRKAPQVSEEAERLYGLLQAAGISVLYDDRDASPGVKFNDADLIGLPLRLTLSPRTLETAAVEVKWRHSGDAQIIPLAEVIPQITRWFSEQSLLPLRREHII